MPWRWLLEHGISPDNEPVLEVLLDSSEVEHSFKLSENELLHVHFLVVDLVGQVLSVCFQTLAIRSVPPLFLSLDLVAFRVLSKELQSFNLLTDFFFLLCPVLSLTQAGDYALQLVLVQLEHSFQRHVFVQ